MSANDRRPEETFDPRVEEAVATVRARAAFLPDVGVVLGSGLGDFAESLGGLVKIPYSAVPHLRAPGVPGHAGSLCFGDVGETSVACLSGRIHLYEGHPVADVVLGCRLLAALGCRVVILTNAAGGIKPGMEAGSLMLIADHINLTGQNPLTGGPRFVDMTRAYDLDLLDAARGAAMVAGVGLAEGVYAQLPGPSYETPAEIRMLRALGADAVGMSTVMETIALKALGVRVGAMSCITNLGAGLSASPLDHRAVQQAARAAAYAFEAVLTHWVRRAGEFAQENSTGAR